MKNPTDRVIDGTSILPLLKGKKIKRKRPLYWRNNSHYFRVAIREGVWKLVCNSERTDFELYNLIVDPRETTDLSAHHPQLFEKMKEKLIEYDNDVLREGPTWWNREKRLKETIPDYN